MGNFGVTPPSTIFNQHFTKGHVDFIGNVIRFSKMPNMPEEYPVDGEIVNNSLEKMLKINNIQIERKYAYTNVNMEAGFKSASKYDKPQPEFDYFDGKCWELSKEWTIRHFSRYCGGSRVVDKEDCIKETDKSTSCGYPWSLKYADKNEFFSDSTMQQLLDDYWSDIAKVENSDDYIPIWTCSQKRELRPLTKLNENKIRTFTACPLEVTIATNRLCWDMNNKFYNTNNKHWSYVGGNKFMQGWDQLYHRLNKHPNGFELDESDYDASLFRRALEEQSDIRFEFLQEKDKTEENRRRMTRLYNTIIHSVIVMENGELVQKHTGNPSGSANTIVDNTMILFRFFAYAWIKLSKQEHDHINKKIRSDRDALNIEDRKYGAEVGTESYFRKNVEAALNGDDNTFSCSDAVVKWFNATTISNVWSAIGVTTKTDCYDPRPVKQLCFLSQSFVEINGMMLPCPDYDRVMGSLLYGSRINDVRWHLMRACALRIESWANIKLRTHIKQYIEYLWNVHEKQLIGSVKIKEGIEINMQQIDSIYKSDEWIESLYCGYEGKGDNSADCPNKIEDYTNTINKTNYILQQQIEIKQGMARTIPISISQQFKSRRRNNSPVKAEIAVDYNPYQQVMKQLTTMDKFQLAYLLAKHKIVGTNTKDKKYAIDKLTKAIIQGKRKNKDEKHKDKSKQLVAPQYLNTSPIDQLPREKAHLEKKLANDLELKDYRLYSKQLQKNSLIYNPTSNYAKNFNLYTKLVGEPKKDKETVDQYKNKVVRKLLNFESQPDTYFYDSWGDRRSTKEFLTQMIDYNYADHSGGSYGDSHSYTKYDLDPRNIKAYKQDRYRNYAKYWMYDPNNPGTLTETEWVPYKETVAVVSDKITAQAAANMRYKNKDIDLSEPIARYVEQTQIDDYESDMIPTPNYNVRSYSMQGNFNWNKKKSGPTNKEMHAKNGNIISNGISKKIQKQLKKKARNTIKKVAIRKIEQAVPRGIGKLPFKGRVNSSVAAAPAAVGSQNIQESYGISGARTMKKFNITRSELLGDLMGTKVFSIQTIPINPGLKYPFKLCSKWAANYDFYVIRHLRFRVEPNSGTNITGSIGMVYDYDPTDVNPQTERDLYAFYHAKLQDAWHECDGNFEPGMVKGRKKFFVRNETTALGSGKNRAQCDPALFYLSTSNFSVDNLPVGKLFIDYDIDFYDPHEAEEVNLEMSWGALGNIITIAEPWSASPQMFSTYQGGMDSAIIGPLTVGQDWRTNFQSTSGLYQYPGLFPGISGANLLGNQIAIYRDGIYELNSFHSSPGGIALAAFVRPNQVEFNAVTNAYTYNSKVTGVSIAIRGTLVGYLGYFSSTTSPNMSNFSSTIRFSVSGATVLLPGVITCLMTGTGDTSMGCRYRLTQIYTNTTYNPNFTPGGLSTEWKPKEITNLQISEENSTLKQQIDELKDEINKIKLSTKVDQEERKVDSKSIESDGEII